jgi:glyoxylase-like metal-dependent hydrolase (beta-lactamase superfamily II)
MTDLTSTMRVLEPYPGIFAYYDGRIPGKRLHSEAPNWLDDGAYSLGVASYAIVDGEEALVYDTSISLPHAQAIRSHLEGLGVKSIRVVLSHSHDDHIAGNEIFADCEIIALKLTAEMLEKNREKIASREPVISPLVMPNRLFEERLDLTVGKRHFELHHFNIHSADGNVIWFPDDKLLLAGDTLEDTITYIAEPQNLAIHIRELERMKTWPIRRILPSHGDPDRIANGGYEPSLIDSNLNYLRRLDDAPDLSTVENLKDLIAVDLASGAAIYFEPYETVHRENLAAVKAARLGTKP